MANSILPGRIVNLRVAKTEKGKEYDVIILEQRKSNGDPFPITVRSWHGVQGLEIGSEVSLPVYDRAFITRQGRALVSYVLRTD